MFNNAVTIQQILNTPVLKELSKKKLFDQGLIDTSSDSSIDDWDDRFSDLDITLKVHNEQKTQNLHGRVGLYSLILVWYKGIPFMIIEDDKYNLDYTIFNQMQKNLLDYDLSNILSPIRTPESFSLVLEYPLPTQT